MHLHEYCEFVLILFIIGLARKLAGSSVNINFRVGVAMTSLPVSRALKFYMLSTDTYFVYSYPAVFVSYDFFVLEMQEIGKTHWDLKS